MLGFNDTSNLVGHFVSSLREREKRGRTDSRGDKRYIMCLLLSRVILLTLSTLGKIFSRRHIDWFSYFSQKTGFDISCKLSQLETICMKCQILFSGKNKKNITNLSSAELAKRVVKVKIYLHY